MRPSGLVAAAVASTLFAAPPALATEHVRVNEIDPAGGFVELLDVIPGEDPFPEPVYVIVVYDGAGTELSSHTLSPPYTFIGGDAPYVVDGLTLPAGTGQVCFERPRDPDGYAPDYRFHCLGYGDVTDRVLRRMPVAPSPGAGQSVQRQPCGKGALAAPTRGAENAEPPGACAGERFACDDPRKWDALPVPKMTVRNKRFQDIDRISVTVKMTTPGTVSMRGSIFVVGMRQGFVFGPFERELEANKPIRIRVRVPRPVRAALKRGLRAGKLGRVFFVSLGKDNACHPSRIHSDRMSYLKP